MLLLPLGYTIAELLLLLLLLHGCRNAPPSDSVGTALLIVSRTSPRNPNST